MFLTIVCFALAADPSPPLAIEPGERIVMVGDALIEREGTYGHIETEILAAFPKTPMTFRNLGWSGDTPAGISRAYFDPPEKGFERLVEQIAFCQPTMVIIGYGMSDALEGTPVDTFRASLERLLDHLPKSVKTIVFLTPVPVQSNAAGDDLRDTQNAHRLRIVDVIGAVADARGAYVIDLDDVGRSSEGYDRDGIHLNDKGYRQVAEIICRRFDPSRGERQVAASEGLRAIVKRKNALYFQRYRPENITYLLGFRAYEQGQNAKEIEALDPKIAELEKQIDGLRAAG